MPRKKAEKTSKTEQDKSKLEKDKTVKTKSGKSKIEKSKSISAEIESKQPVVNIGLVGHVDHGKTTMTECLSGKWTDTHSEELKKGITIRLGYANCVFYQDNSKKGVESYTINEVNEKGEKNKLVRRVSLVDAPGHESLMATMLAGATIMDGAILMVAANEKCPQPQTVEHLQALEIMGIKNIVVVQNKIDLVSPEVAEKNYQDIKNVLSKTPYKDSVIVPISAQYKVNIDALISAIESEIPTPERNDKEKSRFFVARSFDINKPGMKISDISGGVLGGAVQQGIFKVGDDIEIKPGYEVEERNQKIFKPIITKITGIMSGKDSIKVARPGGSVALLTTLDPGIVKSDRLTGSLIGHPGELPDTLYEMELNINLLERVVGATIDLKVEPIKKGEVLMLNVNSAATVGLVTELGKNKIFCKLKIPVCAAKNTRVTISRVVQSRFRLIGFGTIC